MALTLSVLHSFVSAIADSGNASLLQPSNWNASHAIALSGGTANRLLYWTSATAIGDAAGLTYDGTTLATTELTLSSKLNTTVIDSNAASDLLLKYNGTTKVTVSSAGTTFANPVTVTSPTEETFYATGNPANLASLLYNSNVIGAAFWSTKNNNSKLSQVGILGTSHAGIGSVPAGSAFWYSDGVSTGIIAAAAAGYIQFATGTSSLEQFRVTHTASASRYVTVTGSNGGNPTIGVSAGNLAITPAVVGASSADFTAYKVNGAAGADFGPGAPTSITVVKGIITAIS